MTLSATIAAPEVIKLLGIKKNTFMSWLRRGKLDDAIVSKEGKGPKTVYLFDRIKIMNVIHNTTSVAPINPEPAKVDKPTGPTLNQSRATKEGYAALLIKLDYEQRIKKLVEVKEIKRQFYGAARAVRNNLMSIPGRVAAELVGLTDDKEIERILTEEILLSLEGLENVAISES